MQSPTFNPLAAPLSAVSATHAHEPAVSATHALEPAVSADPDVLEPAESATHAPEPAVSATHAHEPAASADPDVLEPAALEPGPLNDLNSLINALDIHETPNVEVRQIDEITNLDNHIYNRIEIINNSIPIDRPGLTLQEVEYLLLH